MQITFLTRRVRNVICIVTYASPLKNKHTLPPFWVSSLILDCNGVFAIKAYRVLNPGGAQAVHCHHHHEQEIKEKAYRTIVRPTVEYASSVWDPHQNYLTRKVESVQRRAARFVTNTPYRYGTDSNLKKLTHPTPGGGCQEGF